VRADRAVSQADPRPDGRDGKSPTSPQQLACSNAVIVGAFAPAAEPTFDMYLALYGAAQRGHLRQAGVEVVDGEEDLEPGFRVLVVDADRQGGRVDLSWPR